MAPQTGKIRFLERGSEEFFKAPEDDGEGYLYPEPSSSLRGYN
jgi:hypothetical protein